MKRFSQWLDEVVVARKITPAEKKARAEYLQGHKERLAHAETGIKKNAATFKQRNTEVGDFSKEPSRMRLIGLMPKKEIQYK